MTGIKWTVGVPSVVVGPPRPADIPELPEQVVREVMVSFDGEGRCRMQFDIHAEESAQLWQFRQAALMLLDGCVDGLREAVEIAAHVAGDDERAARAWADERLEDVA